jgi:hypothetical protein
MAGKDRKAIEKRKQKLRVRKDQKRKAKARSGGFSGAAFPPYPFGGIEGGGSFQGGLESSDSPRLVLQRSSIDHSVAPGYRSIGMTQAMIEFAEPLMGNVESPEALNKCMKLAMAIWNYHAARSGKDVPQPVRKTEGEILWLLRVTLGIDDKAAREKLAFMLDRYDRLFPEELQPGPGVMMVIRNEKAYNIEPFDWETLKLSSQTIPADADDQLLIGDIIRLDRMVANGVDYDRHERLIGDITGHCAERFAKWLVDKGYPEEGADLPACLEIYLSFVYLYGHDGTLTLRNVGPSDLREFLEDHLLRKLYAEPQEYQEYPVALALFYQFLQEKGYVPDAAPIVQELKRLEPRMISLLWKRYST